MNKNNPDMGDWDTVPQNQLAATNQLKNLRAQLESKLEMVMSDRFRTFLDINVKAPLVVVPIDVNLPATARSTERFGDSVKIKPALVEATDASGHSKQKENKVFQGAMKSVEGDKEDLKRRRSGTDVEATAAAVVEATVTAAAVRAAAATTVVEITGTAQKASGSLAGDSPSLASSPTGSEVERQKKINRELPPRGEVPAQVAVIAVAKDLLVIDLGSISLTTARLAHLRRRESSGGQENADAYTAAEVNNAMGDEKEPPDNRGGRGEASARSAVSPMATVVQKRRGRASSDVGSGEGVTTEGWHANFYDVYNVEVCKAGVLLERMDSGGDDVEGLGGWRPRSIVGGGAWVNTAGKASSVEGRGDETRRWLIDPFDVKVSLTVDGFSASVRVFFS